MGGPADSPSHQSVPSILWISGKHELYRHSLTPTGWSERQFPWEASEVETLLTTKNEFLQKTQTLVFLYVSRVSTSDAHIVKERRNLRITRPNSVEEGAG